MFQMMMVVQIEQESIVGLYLWKHNHNLVPRLLMEIDLPVALFLDS